MVRKTKNAHWCQVSRNALLMTEVGGEWADRKDHTLQPWWAEKRPRALLTLKWMGCNCTRLHWFPLSQEQESESTLCTGAPKPSQAAETVPCCCVLVLLFFCCCCCFIIFHSFLFLFLLLCYLIVLFQPRLFHSSTRCFALFVWCFNKTACLGMTTMCTVWVILICESVLAAWLNIAALIMRI